MLYKQPLITLQVLLITTGTQVLQHAVTASALLQTKFSIVRMSIQMCNCCTVLLAFACCVCMSWPLCQAYTSSLKLFVQQCLRFCSCFVSRCTSCQGCSLLNLYVLVAGLCTNQTDTNTASCLGIHAFSMSQCTYCQKSYFHAFWVVLLTCLDCCAGMKRICSTPELSDSNNILLHPIHKVTPKGSPSQPSSPKRLHTHHGPINSLLTGRSALPSFGSVKV